MTYTKILSTNRKNALVGVSCLFFLFFHFYSSGQSKWIPQDIVCSASLRGLSVVDDQIIWASGSDGTWLCTSDGGQTWRNGTVPGASHLDFRDIHALNPLQAWVISAGDTCRIYYTDNGGLSWALQYENFQKDIFFDGFAFWDAYNALAYSDPIEGKFFIIKTTDGTNWQQIDTSAFPNVLKGEAGFAASGTGICVKDDSLAWIASGGGAKARVLHSENAGRTWTVFNTPLVSKEGAGIFSMVFTSKLHGVVVGGSYLDSTNADLNCAVTQDGGRTWKLISKQQPKGYRSCVAASSDGKQLITVGRTGSELSLDGGMTWEGIDGGGYYACAISEGYAWAVGKRGKVAKLAL